MTKPTIFVTQPIDVASLDAMEEEAIVLRGFGPAAVVLNHVIADIDALLVRTDRIGPDLIAKGPRLRAIQRVGAGVDTIDVRAASVAGIPVFNTSGVNANTVAELTIGLALSAAREIPRWDAAVRDGNFDKRNQEPGIQLHGKTWGIVGLGNIGQAVARIAGPGLGMSVLAYHPHRSTGWVQSRGALPVESLDACLAASDVVSVHVPLTASTLNLLGREQFARMRERSILVNMSRGGVIDEYALADALINGPLSAAGVDVFANEPPAPDSPLLGLANVVLSPHRGGRTREATEEQGLIATRRLLDVLRGGSIDEAVNAGALNERSCPDSRIK